MRKLLTTLATSATLALVSAAGAFEVAIVAAAASSPSALNYTEVQRLLRDSGHFDRVDIHALTSGAGTPTLEQLQSYDAVIVWTNTTPDDNELLGDRLADYVDSGGGVVVAVFANSTTTSGRDIGGRWRSPEYEVIVPRSGNTSGRATLGTVHDPSHPIMEGVSAFDGGSSSFRPSVTDLTSGSTAIAEWSDGRVLVAVGANPKRVDLGFYPPPSTVSSSFWDITTDGHLLLANALRFAAGGDTGCYADCDSSGQLDFFDFLCFQNAFAAGEPYADCDDSGQLDFFDFLCFQNEFAAGCR